MENDTDLSKLSKEKKFMKMFDPEKDSDEIIYKNSLLEFNNEIKGKKDTNIKELTHDSLLRRMAMEDYSLFPPNNDSILITDDETLIGKEDPEKLYEEEVNYLRSINAINYLTFSPFGDSFFPYKYKNKTSDNEQCVNDETPNEDTGDTNDRENKILNIIDFDYNNYEINNDLLFNISMGFVDIDKLKHENVVSSENFEPRSERFANGRQLKNVNIKPKVKESIKEDKMVYNKDVELKVNLMNKLVKFVKEHENIEFFSTLINDFYKDLDILQSLNNNTEKNKILFKWEKTFIDRNKLYQKYLVDQQEKERKKRKEERIRKEIEKKIEEKRMFKIQQEKKFEEELNKLRNLGIKKGNKNRQSLYVGSGNIEQQLNISKELNITKTIKSLYTIRSASSGSFTNKIGKPKSIGKKIMKINSIKRKKTKSMNKDNDDDERYGYQKCRSDYFFKLI